MFLLRYYHRAAFNRKICFVRRVMNGAGRRREREDARTPRVRTGGIGEAFRRLQGMENLPTIVPWLRGRDHNLYNGLAKVYPESRFCEETGTGGRREGTDPFRSQLRTLHYNRDPTDRPPRRTSPPRLHFIHNVPAYEPVQSRIRR